jgi:wobble nucleotide-excising tRNase
MKAEVRGYRNITGLEYEIDNKKINMLFGVSGSGKSSIAMALCSDDLEFNKKVDYFGETHVFIDGEPANKEQVMVFNSECVNNYFVSEDEGSVFRILIDDENELIKEQVRFDKYMERFKTAIDSYDNLYKNLKELSSNFVGTLTSKDQLRSSSKIRQIETSLNGKGNTRIVKEINNMDYVKLNWIIQGNDLIEGDSKCPFCLKKINKKRISKIKLYSEFDTKNLKLVKDKEIYFSYVGISKLSYTENGIKKLSSELQKVAIAVYEYEKLKDIFKNIDGDLDLKSIKKFEIKQEMYQFFPNLEKIVVMLNQNITNIKEKTMNLNFKTKEVLSRKIKGLNEKIIMLGIPYQIEVQYKKDKTKSYKLKLIKDQSEIDRRKSLSNGERNLIAFLIFALDVSKNGKDKLCIIDDPVSSYDEHRRKLIYEYIKEILSDITVLVLSHDSVFARIAANDRSSKLIGSINYFENTEGKVELIKITEDDFMRFDDFLFNRINETEDYYKKIINLRMLYEGSRGHVYNYLSKIIHHKGRTQIDAWLNAISKTETEILERIEKEKMISIPPFDDKFLERVDMSSYSLIEKAALVREYLPTTHSHFRNELNHIMHINDRHIICLNPHKYSFCSEKTRNQISKEITKISSNIIHNTVSQ